MTTPYPKVAILLSGSKEIDRENVAALLAKTVRATVVSLDEPIYDYVSSLIDLSKGELKRGKLTESIHPFIEALRDVTRKHLPPSPFADKIIRHYVSSEDMLVIPSISHSYDVDSFMSLTKQGWDVIMVTVSTPVTDDEKDKAVESYQEDAETEYDTTNYIIPNNGNLKDLAVSVNKFLNEYLDVRLAKSSNRSAQYKPLSGSAYQPVIRVNPVSAYLDQTFKE